MRKTPPFERGCGTSPNDWRLAERTLARTQRVTSNPFLEFGADNSLITLRATQAQTLGKHLATQSVEEWCHENCKQEENKAGPTHPGRFRYAEAPSDGVNQKHGCHDPQWNGVSDVKGIGAIEGNQSIMELHFGWQGCSGRLRGRRGEQHCRAVWAFVSHEL